MKAKIGNVEFEVETQKDLEMLISYNKTSLPVVIESLPKNIRKNRLTADEKLFIKNQISNLGVSGVAKALNRSLSTISTYSTKHKLRLRRNSNNYKAWTKGEDLLVMSGKPINELKRMLGRSKGSILQRQYNIRSKYPQE